MMHKLHSKATAWWLLCLAVTMIEVFFGFRAAVMYGAFLSAYLDVLELIAFQICVGVGVAIGGYVLSTHRQYGLEAIAERIAERARHAKDYRDKLSGAETGVLLACLVVVLHEIAGVIYTVFGKGQPVTWIAIVVCVGMCAFVLLPFFLGHMMLALAESLGKEKAEDFDNRIDALDRQMKIEAAQDLVDGASDLPPEKRIQGIRTLLPRESGRKRQNVPLGEVALNQNGHTE